MSEGCTHPLGARDIHDIDDLNGYAGDGVMGTPLTLTLEATCFNCGEPAPVSYEFVEVDDS